MLNHIKEVNPKAFEQSENRFRTQNLPSGEGAANEPSSLQNPYGFRLNGYGMTDLEASDGLESIRTEAELFISSDSGDVQSFTQRVLVLDDKLRTSYEDDEKRLNARTQLCSVTKSVVCVLQNEEKRIKQAVFLAKAISVEFDDLPLIGKELNIEVNQLKDKAVRSEERRRGKKLGGCLLTILIVVLLTAGIEKMIAYFADQKDKKNRESDAKNIKTTSTPTPTEIVTATPTEIPEEKKYSQNEPIGSRVYLDVLSIAPMIGIRYGMNNIENWNLLNARMKEENPELISSLFQIHMGAFDDLRKKRLYA